MCRSLFIRCFRCSDKYAELFEPCVGRFDNSKRTRDCEIIPVAYNYCVKRCPHCEAASETQRQGALEQGAEADLEREMSMLRVSESGQGPVDGSAQEQERMRQTLQEIQRLDRPDEKGSERKIQSLNVYGEKNADGEVTVGSSTGERNQRKRG